MEAISRTVVTPDSISRTKLRRIWRTKVGKKKGLKAEVQGSVMWTWLLMSPGITYRPPRSMISAGAPMASVFLPAYTTFPSRMRTIASGTAAPDSTSMSEQFARTRSFE